jgi:8-oxo-dGTP pyrophosphatase MutT (NUDIX family)
MVRQQRKVVQLADYQLRKLAKQPTVESSAEGWTVAKSPTPEPSYPPILVQPSEDRTSTMMPNFMPRRRETSRASPILQSGALAYRPTKDGEPLVLLVSKKRSKQWGIPKGKVEAHLSFGENAAKEAFEEAGVKGRISPTSVGVFRANKRTPDRSARRVIEVWVYLLEVTEVRSKWPEKGKRQIQWVPCRTAAALLREPVLVYLCENLPQRAPGAP